MRTCVLSHITICLILSASILPLPAQDLGGASAIGLRAGATHYQGDDFKAALPKATASFFLEHFFSNRFSIEGNVSGSELAARTGDRRFRTRQYGVGMAMRLGILPSELFRPYLAAGVEYNTFDIKRLSGGSANAGNLSNRTKGYFAFPVGTGLSLRLTSAVTFDVRGYYHIALEDLYDGTDFGKKDDHYFSAGAGVTWVLRSDQDQDLDGDGLLTSVEKKLKTNPRIADTDGDGLSDGAEVLTHGTDPLLPDTDGDGLLDGEEIAVFFTDPLKADTDGDGLTDREESVKIGTDPLKADTDGDGLADNEELRVRRTDPKNSDTDGDQLSDGEEVYEFKTNPLLADTDGDGLNDYQEIRVLQTNPLVADILPEEDPESSLVADKSAASLPAVGEKLDVGAIHFRSGSAELLNDSEPALSEAARILEVHPSLKLGIHGYTDDTGNIVLNMQLSQNRAEVVYAKLVQRGIDPRRLRALGFGPRNPVASNSTEEGRRQNRRIEFIVR